jgi:hypothetical protein
MLAHMSAHGAAPAHVRAAAAGRALELVAAGGLVDAVVRKAVAMARHVPEAAALFATATRLVSAATRGSHGGSNGVRAQRRASLKAIAQVHAHVGTHAQPCLRHEAFRLVRAATGTAPSLVEYAERAEDANIPEASAAAGLTAGPTCALPHLLPNQSCWAPWLTVPLASRVKGNPC